MFFLPLPTPDVSASEVFPFSPPIVFAICGTVLGAAVLLLRRVSIEEVGDRLERAFHYIK